MILKVKKMTEEAKLTQAYQGDLWDVYSQVDVNIERGKRALVGTGIAVQLDYGWRIVIRPRSSYTLKGIDAGIGSIDSEYRGEIKAILINNTNETVCIKKGDKIGQLALEKDYNDEVEIEYVDFLNLTQRGDGCFGSTGN